MRALLVSSLLPFLAGAIAALLVSLLRKAGGTLIIKLSSSRKLAPLVPAIPVAEDALAAAVAVIGAELGKRPMLTVVKDAGVAAEAVIVTQRATLENVASAELHVLVDGPSSLQVTAPGGAAVNMPEIK